MIISVYLKELCPFWDLLDEIYGTKVNITPPFVHDSNSVPEIGSHDNWQSITIQEDGEVVFNLDGTGEDENGPPQVEKSTEAVESSTPTSTADKVKRILVAPPKGIRVQKDAFSSLNDVQEKRIEAMNKKTELEQKRLEAEKVWNSDSIGLKRQELESQERRHQEELAMKSKEIETQKELKIKELEKEERIEKYKIDMEFKLQLALRKNQD
jgi:hypothetical protein